MGIADKVLAIAASYVGRKGGDFVWDKLGLPNFKGQPWCCGFGDVVYDEADFPIGEYLDCLSIQTGLIAAGAVKCSPKELKPAGAVIYEFDLKGDSWDHFGICELNPGGYIQAIEGNVSDSVGRRTRSYAYIRACYNIDWQEPEKYTGWLWDDQREKCYHYTDGKLDKNAFFEGTYDWKGRWYYVGAEGYFLVDQWVYYKGSWYFLKPDGAAAVNEWEEGRGDYAGKWFYLGADGKPAKNKAVNWNGKTFYLGEDGAAVVNKGVWKDGKCYFFGADGALVKHGGGYFSTDASGAIDNLWD